jgi:hypothetical protein
MQMKLLERQLNPRLAEAGFKTVGERTIRIWLKELSE